MLMLSVRNMLSSVSADQFLGATAPIPADDPRRFVISLFCFRPVLCGPCHPIVCQLTGSLSTGIVTRCDSSNSGVSSTVTSVPSIWECCLELQDRTCRVPSQQKRICQEPVQQF